MKVLVFGGSGLIGDGFVREALRAGDVTEVVSVGRAPLGLDHPRLRHVVHADFLDFGALRAEFTGVAACLWGLGVSAGRVSARDYERVTHDFTAAAVRVLAEVSPGAAFAYVSGGGTDRDGRSRWARVEGRTEDLVIGAFARGYALRPGFVLSAHGRRSATPAYRWAARAVTPLAPVLRLAGLGPLLLTDTAQLGRAALNLARRGYPERVLENRDIVALGGAG
ncbi:MULTISPECIES: epimerase [Actinosynnema]|uniref:epimerase n=1 Tax=Actinosynnema TaxID=40566 RepID=UPI0020A5240E|nr:epimerase [Actinosynnema pretiosum]MCP2098776.1 NADH(P)-binding [Actinosynnema pretiosum]